MHRHDRLRALGEAALDVDGVEVERQRIDVGEHRRRMPPRDRLGRRVERERRADDLVALADAERIEGDHECVGAVGDADRLSDAEVVGGLAFESVDFRAEDEPSRLEDSCECLLQLGDQRRVLRLDVNVRNRRHGEPW